MHELIQDKNLFKFLLIADSLRTMKFQIQNLDFHGNFLCEGVPYFQKSLKMKIATILIFTLWCF